MACTTTNIENSFFELVQSYAEYNNKLLVNLHSNKIDLKKKSC